MDAIKTKKERQEKAMEKELKAANQEVKETDGRELNPEELEQVTGGGNPFAQYARVPNQNYDDNIRGKV